MDNGYHSLDQNTHILIEVIISSKSVCDIEFIKS